jgi:hypothetical protein
MHGPASATSEFGAANAYDGELRRHPVQHLADAFTDRVERAAATRARRRRGVEHDLPARPIRGKRLAPWPAALWLSRGLLRGLGARFVGLQVLQSEGKLIGINAFGSTAVLCALKLSND